MIPRILGSSRYLVLFAVLGSFVASATTMIYAGAFLISNVLTVITSIYSEENGAKRFSVTMIELIDLYLLGIVLYLVAEGLYELFINPNLPAPAWMKVHSLEQLKSRIVSVVIVLLGVTFIGKAVSWDGGWEIIAFGGAIAVVIAALCLALRMLAEESAHYHP
ncbi:MAG: YqhA family protein [Dehalococcoidia bacterium]